MRIPFVVIPALALWTVSACGGETPDNALPVWEASVDTIADTIVVRTTGGSTWGDTATLVPEVVIGVLDGDDEYMFGSINALNVAADGTIYAMDRQVPALRVYDATGTYVMTIGREGGGPGEYKQTDGGLSVLSDGRVLLRDPGNARIQVYSPEGEDLDTWPMRGGFQTSSPLWIDRDDHSYVNILMDMEADVTDWRFGLVQLSPEGIPGDTLEPPDLGYEGARVEARSENSASINSVPFSPDEDWVLHPDGFFVHGLSTEYRFTIHRTDDLPIRVERDYEPVRVTPAEAEEEKLRITRNFRSFMQGWTWNGPAIPNVKPPFRDIHVGQDGNIWLRLYTAAVEREDPDYDPTDQFDTPDNWVEPIMFDVFQPDGRFLGTVKAPDGFATYPTPVFRGDYVWAVSRDEFDVQRIVRYRIDLPELTTDE